jgi:hypothetical protein
VDSSGRFIYVLDVNGSVLLQYSVTMLPQAPLFLRVRGDLVGSAPVAVLVVK